MNREAQSVVALLVGGAVLRISFTDVYLRYVKEGLRPFLIAAGLVLVAIALITIWRELRRPGKVKPTKAKDAAGATAAPASAETVEQAAAETSERTPATSLEKAPAKSPVKPPEKAAVPAVEGATVAGTVAVVHAEDVDDPDDGHGHSHSHGGPWVAWLLILPVLAIFLVAPPALGSYSASRSGANSAVQQKSDFPPLAKTDPVAVPMVEYVGRALWEDGKSMEGRNIRLTGFLSPREGGGAYLTRIVLSCCAADGRPVKVRLDGDVPAAEPDTWLEVTGTYVEGTEKDKLSQAEVPTLKVDKVTPIPPPRNPYEG